MLSFHRLYKFKKIRSSIFFKVIPEEIREGRKEETEGQRGHRAVFLSAILKKKKCRNSFIFFFFWCTQT